MVSGKLPLEYGVPAQPRQLRLDTTTACNAQCLSCHRTLSPRRGGMSEELLTQLLDDVGKWVIPLQEVVPVNYGEFFILSNWAQLLNTISIRLPHTSIVIPTNGSLLDSDNLVGLVRCKTLRVINWSINAYLPKTYEGFMGLDYSVVESIKQLSRLIRYHRGEIVQWFSMVFDPLWHSEAERDMFVTYWRQYGVPQVLCASSCNRTPLKLTTTLPCRSIFSDVVVGYDGKLSSCCFDSAFTLDLGWYSGDLFKDWQNRQLTALREAHNQGRRQFYNLCRRCSFA